MVETGRGAASIRGRLWTCAAGVLMLAVLSGGMRPASPEPTADMADAGRRLAEALCAPCHLSGNESEKTAPSSVPGFRAIANRRGQSAEGIVLWLRSIPPMMPNHRLSRLEMEQLAAYIQTLRDQ